MNKQEKLIDYNRVMELFYNLQVFVNLNDAETYLYFESSDYIYAMLQDEMNFGKIFKPKYEKCLHNGGGKAILL